MQKESAREEREMKINGGVHEVKRQPNGVEAPPTPTRGGRTGPVAGETARSGRGPTVHPTQEDYEIFLPDTGYYGLESVKKSHEDIQRLRLAIQDRILKATKGESPATKHFAILNELVGYLKKKETQLARLVGKEVEKHPMGKWLLSIRGMGPLSASGFLLLFDPTKAPGPRSFWKFAGQEPGARLRKGERSPYCVKARALCRRAGESWVKVKGDYTPVYYEVKERYKDDKPFIAHRKARAQMVKAFLKDYWKEWQAYIERSQQKTET